MRLASAARSGQNAGMGTAEGDQDLPQPGSLLTIGHGTSDRTELTHRLLGANITSLVDVRRFPGSRRDPEVSREAMEVWVRDEGIGYAWEQRLGGRRQVAKSDDTDSWWRVQAFRAYAAHTRTAEFQAAMSELVSQLRDGTVAVMCSEFVWWRCHRRIISDVAMLVHDVPVVHVMPDGRLQRHQPSDGARTDGGGLIYPAAV